MRNTKTRPHTWRLLGSVALSAAGAMLAASTSVYGQLVLQHELAVERDGIPTRRVRLVERQTATQFPRGSVILLTGGFGQDDYYEQGNDWKRQTVDGLLALGIDVWVVSFLGPHGWAEHALGAGYRTALGIVEDICSYIEYNSRSTNLGAQGNSGGGLQILYALQAGHCDFNVAIASGTPIARHKAIGHPTLPFCWGEIKTDYLADLDFGDCQSNELQESEWEALDADALAGQPLSHVSSVHIINSDDHPSNPTHGWWLFEALGFPKHLHSIPGSSHEVDGTEAGSRLIVSIIDRGLEK